MREDEQDERRAAPDTAEASYGDDEEVALHAAAIASNNIEAIRILAAEKGAAAEKERATKGKGKGWRAVKRKTASAPAARSTNCSLNAEIAGKSGAKPAGKAAAPRRRRNSLTLPTAAVLQKAAAAAEMRAALNKKPSAAGKAPEKASLGRAVTAVMALKKFKDPSQMCRDMYGRKHDIGKLRDRRFKAVMSGMTYMRKFLQKNKYEALFAIGDDAPSIFFEIWYTSADSRIRARAFGIAKELLQVYEKKIVKAFKSGVWKPDTSDFFEYMYMLRAMHEMDLDCEPLLEAADACWASLGLSNTDKLFGHTVSGANSIDWVTTENWLMLLMQILIMEYNRLLFSNRYPITWGMHEAFESLKRHELKAPSRKDTPTEAGQFHDSIYLATHIVYALNAYQSIPTRERDCPWLFAFCRKSLKYWLQCDQRNLKRAKSGVTTKELVDVDGVSECVDVLRGCGQSEAACPLLTQGVLYLLRVQRPDGSFPVEFMGDPDGRTKKDFYDQIHPAWVATQALRDRDYKIERKGNMAWMTWIDRVVKATNFGALDYEPTWKVPSAAGILPRVA